MATHGPQSSSSEPSKGGFIGEVQLCAAAKSTRSTRRGQPVEAPGGSPSAAGERGGSPQARPPEPAAPSRAPPHLRVEKLQRALKTPMARRALRSQLSVDDEDGRRRAIGQRRQQRRIVGKAEISGQLETPGDVMTPRPHGQARIAPHRCGPWRRRRRNLQDRTANRVKRRRHSRNA